MIAALGKRGEYAQTAINKFHELLGRNEANENSFELVVLACATLGDVTGAFEILNLMKRRGMKTSTQMLTNILAVYSKACTNQNLEESLKNDYVKDAWKILSLIEEHQNPLMLRKGIDTMLQMYACHLEELKQAEGLVLPLYERKGVGFSPKTFEVLMQAYKNTGNLAAVDRVWELARSQEDKSLSKPSFKQLDIYLQTSVKLAKVKQTVMALRAIKEMNRKPRVNLISAISRIENLPLQIYAELMDDKEMQFGLLRQKKNITKLEGKEKKVIERGNLRRTAGI